MTPQERIQSDRNAVAAQRDAAMARVDELDRELATLDRVLAMFEAAPAKEKKEKTAAKPRQIPVREHIRTIGDAGEPGPALGLADVGADEARAA